MLHAYGPYILATREYAGLALVDVSVYSTSYKVVRYGPNLMVGCIDMPKIEARHSVC